MEIIIILNILLLMASVVFFIKFERLKKECEQLLKEIRKECFKS